MWNRAEIKERAKQRFKENYWRCVLVGLILTFLLGNFSGNSSGNFNQNDLDQIKNSTESGKIVSDLPDAIGTINEAGFPFIPNPFHEYATSIAIVSIVIAAIFFLVCVIAIPLQVFLLNPLIVGCRRYFIKNSDTQAQTKELGYSFDNKYLSNVKTMFFKDLFTFLWSLLLIVPGIIKSYEYRMIPYILADHSDITTEDAFALSKKMMNGNKLDTFILDLSFIGWHLLNAVTFGILGIFYVMPYKYQTDAELYRILKQPEQEDIYRNFEE